MLHQRLPIPPVGQTGVTIRMLRKPCPRLSCKPPPLSVPLPLPSLPGTRSRGGTCGQTWGSAGHTKCPNGTPSLQERRAWGEKGTFFRGLPCILTMCVNQQKVRACAAPRPTSTSLGSATTYQNDSSPAKPSHSSLPRLPPPVSYRSLQLHGLRCTGKGAVQLQQQHAGSMTGMPQRGACCYLPAAKCGQQLKGGDTSRQRPG